MKNIENVFLLEITNSCKFNCPGCNINKIKKKKQLISNEDLIFLNKVLENYYEYNYKIYPDIDFVEIVLFFGPGDFFGYFNKEEITNISNIFNEKFSLLYAGNYSVSDYREKIEYVLKNIKKFKEINFNIIFNPYLTDKEAKYLKNNVEKMYELKDKYENEKKFKIDIAATVNLSKKYFDDLSSIKFSLDKAIELGIKKVAFAFAPTKFILQLKGENFQTNIKKINEWYYNYFKTLLEDKYYNYFNEVMLLNIKGKQVKKIENMEVNYKNYNKLYENVTHEFLIDSKLNLSVIKDHLGEFWYNEANGLKSLFNIKEKGENALNDLYKDSLYVKYRINDYKKLINDEQCSKCPYLLHCANLGVGTIEETYKDIFGKKNEEYCYGYKKSIDFIKENYQKYQKFFNFVDKYYEKYKYF